MFCLWTGWSALEGIADGITALALDWKIFDEAGLKGAVGPGSRGVSSGHSGLVAVVVPGPSTGSFVKPPEGRPVKKL